VAGKLDWQAFGLPVEGTLPEAPFIGDLARRDVPTCCLDEQVGSVRKRAEQAGWRQCVVVSDGHVVLGHLGKAALEGDPQARAEDAMRPGPSTFRHSVGAKEMLDYMEKHDLTQALVTRSDGTLIGVVTRVAVEEATRSGSTEGS
jgi:Mg/Co/Ni transporter MgtE